MVKDITCISLLPTSPPLQKIKKMKKKATNLQVLRNRSTCTYDIGVGMVNTPPPYSCWTSTV